MEVCDHLLHYFDQVYWDMYVHIIMFSETHYIYEIQGGPNRILHFCADYIINSIISNELLLQQFQIIWILFVSDFSKLWIFDSKQNV